MTVEKQHPAGGQACRGKRPQPVPAVRRIDPSVEDEIARQYGQASRRILFLDYDGTLVPLAPSPEQAVPDASVLDLVRRLAAEVHNTVVVISGRERGFLDRCFGALLEAESRLQGALILVAEHGAFVRRGPEGWTGAGDADRAWKRPVRPVLQRYADRCAGAFVEEKTLSLAWHYRRADSETARQRARELQDELRLLVAGDGTLQVLEGHKVIEIKESGYDKGSAVLRLLGGAAYDFLLALGDDRTDEDVFRVLPPEALTIRVGAGPTRARYHLASQPEAIALLRRLGKL